MTDIEAQPTPARLDRGHLLEVEDLHVEFRTRDGVAQVINGVSLPPRPGRDAGHARRVRLRQVGHRAGRSWASSTPRPASITGGQVLLRRRGPADAAGGASAAQVRGKEIAMIFQDALSALNPVFTVGCQIAEMLRTHAGMSQGRRHAAGRSS